MEEFLPGDDAASKVQLKNHSVTPALIKSLAGFENAKMYSIIGSDDQLPQSPDFKFGGSVDGAGWLKSPDGKGFVYITNHEDNFAVSRISFDETLKPVKGEYILNSDGGQWRLCSATLATPQEHGFGPVFLTCGESGPESRTHALNPFAPANSASVTREKPALGRWSAENAVPLAKDAYSGKTVIIIGDDDSSVGGGQIALYISNQGDLDNGHLYVLKRRSESQREMDMTTGATHSVEFVKIENHEALTGAEINARVDSLKAIKFGRVEDIDYRKGGGANSREIYFNVTGQNNSGANADYSRSKYGRVYRLVLDPSNPLKGSLTLVLNGDDRNGKAKLFQNPDNIVVTNHYAYIKEDPNGYGDETHDSYIYQYNLITGDLKPALELDHRRNADDAAKYNVGGTSEFGDWEYGAMVDISELTGIPGTFSVNIQPHTWRGEAYKNPDGGSLRPDEDQASQMIIIKGLPR
ncbi:hypothetical protein GXP67_35855 [Rhodocytophaga rosea]|uniref:DUF839 domain-containing protein n=1 Tax=Rhodocytophaga rosea TaxID=2704465 RepID=A0A6C0GVK1_9BACT|nr:hypothetical protein GXP67_35855 [Rhodocytophaga rosea]